MSSARVESPLEYRRQPSPPCASTMPKPRACRKLFPVDHAETNRSLRDQTARLEQEQRRDFGFDFDRYEPLPTQNSSSRYTDWEAIPAEEAPSFYHETVAKRKPLRQSTRPTSTSCISSSHQSSTNGSIHSVHTSMTTVKTETSRLETGSSRSFLPVHPEAVRPAPAKNLTSSISPKPCPKEIIQPVLEQASGSAEASQPCGDGVFSGPRDNIENGEGSITSSSCEPAATNKPRTSATQSSITDFMRQRKRNGSGSSSVSSVSSSDAEGEKHHQVPTKRRRPGSSGEVSSPVIGHS